MEFSESFLGGYVSKLIDVRRFKEENSFTVEQLKPSKIKDNTIMAKLKLINPNVDSSRLSSEMKQCEEELQKHNFRNIFDSPDTLSARGLLPIYGIINNSDLKTLRVVKSDLFQIKRTKLYTPPPSFTPRGGIVPGQTLLLTLSLYYPFHWLRDQFPDEAVIPRCKKVVQFHESQTLNDLKRYFKCENECSEISGDISNDPHKPLEFIVNNDLKHGLFYINKQLYVDCLEDGSTLAHAKVMKKWAESNGHSIESISTMSTKLLELKVRIGEPYIYQHLGRCEHLFIFNEISFAQSTDCLGQSNYPRLICVAKEKLKNCMFCSKSISTVVMLNNNNRTPVTVNHMCESCFLLYNYDNMGDCVSDFKAYRTLKWKK